MHHKTMLTISNSLSALTADYHDVIDQIFNSRLIISSSLHGIILAEAYGRPAILLKDSETENLFKYNDYYYSTNRFSYPIVSSVEEALQMEPPSVPDLSEIRNNIINTFPYDLWYERL